MLVYGGPRLRRFTHRGRRGDGVDGGHFRATVCHGGHRLVGINSAVCRVHKKEEWCSKRRQAGDIPPSTPSCAATILHPAPRLFNHKMPHKSEKSAYRHLAPCPGIPNHPNSEGWGRKYPIMHCGEQIAHWMWFRSNKELFPAVLRESPSAKAERTVSNGFMLRALMYWW